MRSSLGLLSLLVLATPLAAQTRHTPRTDSVDAYVRQQMALRRIPGLSLAIVDSGRIVYTQGYGEADVGTHSPVTPATLFQAGSISKPVSALGALHLVEQGKLSLDGPINDVLTTWKVPDNRFTDSQKVTLRRLLSHSAGVTVHGFPGYDVAGPIPTLVQVLDGAPPANTAPIRVDTTPGAIWRYSGGGITIMQQAMIDVAREPFPSFMRRVVLGPIGMSSSSFEQPQPTARERLMATGYYADRTPVRGRWHVYPEMAAAGLWTTPTDLARFVIEIQQTLAGKGHHVISPEMARQYVTQQKRPSGLGIIVDETGGTLVFSHDGRDEGFDAQMIGLANGQGLAVMINANDNSGFTGRIQRYIARLYRAPGAAADQPAVVKAAPIDPAVVARYAGLYELQENFILPLATSDDGRALVSLTDGFPDEVFLPLDSVTFGSTERQLRFALVRSPVGDVTGLVWRSGEGPRERRVSRIGPLPGSLAPVADPDTALTTRLDLALHALAAGGSTLAAAPGITAGAKKDFAGGTLQGFHGFGGLSFLMVSDVASRQIHRHGHDVAQVRYYRAGKLMNETNVLVYLTEDGQLTDYDLLSR